MSLALVRQTATCTRCKVERPAEDFHANARKRNGLDSWCKPCTRDAGREWRRSDAGVAAREAYRRLPEVKAAEASGHRRVWSDESGWARRQIQCIRSRCKRSGIAFNLEPSDLVVPTYCPVLGIKLRIGTGRHADESPSVDRVDPALGYVRGNVAVISNRANRIKNNGTTDEHRRIAAWMASVGAP